MEITKPEKQSEQILKTEHPRLWENFKRYTIHIMSILERKKERAAIIETVMTENFPKLIPDTKPHIKEAQRIPR